MLGYGRFATAAEDVVHRTGFIRDMWHCYIYSAGPEVHWRHWSCSIRKTELRIRHCHSLTADQIDSGNICMYCVFVSRLAGKERPTSSDSVASDQHVNMCSRSGSKDFLIIVQWDTICQCSSQIRTFFVAYVRWPLFDWRIPCILWYRSNVFEYDLRKGSTNVRESKVMFITLPGSCV